ncbi:MAG: glycine-rich domain-containing protein [Kiritimatiellia bacterium]
MKKSWKSATVGAMVALLSIGVFAACPEGLDGMGLTIWLDATDIDGLGDGNPAENTAINSWTDKASGLQFTPIIGGYTADQHLPHLYSNGRAGKDVVSFGRVNAINQAQYLGATDSRIATLFDNTNTAFVVAQATLGGSDNNTQTTTYFFARKGWHSGFGFMGYPLATALQNTRWFGGTAANANNKNMMPAAPYTNGTWIAASRIIRGGTTIVGASSEIFINNRLRAASTNATESLWGHGGSANTMYVGCSGTQNGTYCGGMSGHIAEMLIFNRELTAEEHAKVWKYLNARWQLAGDDEYTYDDGVIRSNDGTVKRTVLGGGKFCYEFTVPRGEIKVSPVSASVLERALLVGAGGAGGLTLGGGGAGGGVVEYADLDVTLPQEFTLSVGEGGVGYHLCNLASAFWATKGGNGGKTTLHVDGNEYVAYGGGGGASWSATAADSTSGSTPLANAGGGSGAGGKGGIGIDHNGADVVGFAISHGNGAGGGGGAGGDGQAACQSGTLYYAGTGGCGVTNNTTGIEVEYGAGGGGGGGNGIHRGLAGGVSAGDGGEASQFGGPQIGFDGLDGRGGGGGGGGYAYACSGGRGGSGAVILVIQKKSFAIADSFSLFPEATARGEIVATYVGEAEEGSTYLVSLEGDSTQLPSVGWTACGGDLPTFQFPTNTPYGTVTVYYHVKDVGGDIATYSAQIAYVDPADCVPMVTVKDAMVTYDESIGGVTPITVDMVKVSVEDDYGIYSETLDVTGICTASTNTTLTVTNRLGIAAGATATVTASTLLCFVSPDGDDGTGTGWSDAPLKTITNALALAEAGYTFDGLQRTVYLMEGTYSASDGQSFPITLVEGVNFKGAGMGKAIVDAEGAANHLVIPSSTVPFAISGFSLRNAQARFLQASAANFALKDVEMSGCATGNGCIYICTYANARTVSFENLVMTNIAVTVNQGQLVHAGGSGALSFDKCRFADIAIAWAGNGTGFKVCYAQNTGADHFYASGWPATVTDCVFEDWEYAGYNNSQEIGVLTFANSTSPHIFDRCVFRNMKVTNGQRGVLMSPNRGSTNYIVRNCLFESIERVVFNSFQTYPSIYNCTIHNCGSAFWPHFTIYAYNCSVSSCTGVAEGGSSSLYLRNTNIYDTPYENQYNADNSFDLTFFNPFYKNADAGNFDLKVFSKLVDLGNNSYVSGDKDFAGTTRILDGGSGTATVDVGCFEYDPAASGAGIKFETANYGLFEDRSLTLRAKVDPAPEGTVTANVGYPEGVFGPATVTLGGDWTSFVVTATNDFEQADGTVVELTLADAAGELEEGSVGLTLYSRIVMVPNYKARVFLRQGETASLAMQLPSLEFGAPGAIGVTADEMGGTGTGSIVWAGDGFADGANAADQTVALAGGLGSNTLTLTLGNGFTFAESGTDKLAIEVVGFVSPLVVDPANGSDGTGLGTAEAPLASLNYALGQLRSGEAIAATAGRYTTVANGGNESAFPIIVAPGISIIGVRGETDDETDSTVVDPNLTAGAFVLGTLGGDPGTIAAGALRNVVIRRSNGVAVNGRYWMGTIENCAFKELSGAGTDSTVAGFFDLTKGATSLVDVDVYAITSTAARVIYIKNGTGNAAFTRCHFHDLQFTPNNIGMAGLVDSRQYISVDDCVFEDIVNTLTGNQGESLGMVHNYYSGLAINRCLFRNLTLNYPTVGGNRVMVYIDNSLFYNIKGGGPVFRTFRTSINVTGCTVDDVDLVFMNESDGTHTYTMANSSLSRARLNSSPQVSGGRIRNVALRNTNLSDILEGTGYTTNMSVNVTLLDPGFKNIANRDYHLKGSSALRDIGDNTLVAGTTDLDGNDRIFRADKGGIVDLGCYENSTLGGTVFLLR